MPPRKSDNQTPVPKEIPAGRTPPHNIDAETSVLGALLIDQEAVIKVADFLLPDDFYRYDYGLIYETIVSLFERRLPVDIVTVANELESRKKLGEVGGHAALSSLVSSVATSTNVQHWGNIVREKALLRRLIGAASRIGELAYHEDEPSDAVLDQAEQTLFDVTQKFMKQNFTPVRSILSDSFERLDALQKQDGGMRGVPTGFRQVDNILGGLQKSDLIILAARPSMGKTAWALNIAEHVAVREKKTVAIFSLEMSKEQLVDRLVSSLGLIDSWKLRNGKLTDDDFRNLNEAYGMLAESNLFIDDAASASVMEVRAKARRLQSEHGLDLIVIDYLQLMEGRSKTSDNRVQEVSEISRSLKALAKEINCPVIALSQLSRAVESRPDKRPMLSDLRESGCLTGDSLVTLCEDGRRIKLEELVGKKDFYVWGIDDRLKMVKQKVSKVFSSGYKQVYALQLKSGRIIKASSNHKFKTYDKWVALENLNVGRKIAIPRIINNNLSELNEMSDEKIILLAHMIGDGCFVKKQPIHYTSADYQNIEIVSDSAKKAFNIDARIVPQKNWWHSYLKSPYRLSRNKRHPFMEWINEIGLDFSRSYEKSIPEIIFSMSDRQIMLFLHHLWATDGCISLSNNISIYYSTTSRDLADGVQSLLLRLGILSSIHVVPQRKGLKVYRDSYHVSIQSKDEKIKFLKRINSYGKRGSLKAEAIKILSAIKVNPNNDTFDSIIWNDLIKVEKQASGMTERAFQSSINTKYCGSSLYKSGLSRQRMQRVANSLLSSVLSNLANSDIYFDEIISITPLLVQEVYDMTVEGIHNFVTNDIIVHNSIEQDADVVMFLYRDDYYNKEEPNHLMEILVRKHRNGPTGDATLLSRLQFSRFENIDTRHLPQN